MPTLRSTCSRRNSPWAVSPPPDQRNPHRKREEVSMSRRTSIVRSPPQPPPALPGVFPELAAFVEAHGRLPRLGDERVPWSYRGWLLPYLIELHGLIPAVANRWGY